MKDEFFDKINELQKAGFIESVIINRFDLKVERAYSTGYDIVGDEYVIELKLKFKN